MSGGPSSSSSSCSRSRQRRRRRRRRRRKSRRRRAKDRAERGDARRRSGSGSCCRYLIFLCARQRCVEGRSHPERGCVAGDEKAVAPAVVAAAAAAAAPFAADADAVVREHWERRLFQRGLAPPRPRGKRVGGERKRRRCRRGWREADAHARALFGGVAGKKKGKGGTGRVSVGEGEKNSLRG